MNNPEFAKRLARFSTLAAAAAIGGGEAAHAGVVVWNVNQPIPGTGSVDLTASFNTAFDINFKSSGTGGGSADRYFWGPNNNLDFINYSSSTNNDPARWGSNVLIDAAAQAGNASAGGDTNHYWYDAITSQTSSHDLQNNWTDGTSGFLGIRFDAGGGNFHYGWADITADGNGVMTVNRWALETDAGVGVLTGQAGAPAPAPGTLGLMALAGGAGGLRLLRRRRKEQAAQA